MSLDQITVRPFTPDEWPLYKQVRLKALMTDPGVFTSTYAKESAWPDEKWISGVTNLDMGVFGIFDGDRIIGMTGVVVDKNDATRMTAVLWGSWLEKDWRGKGISKKMYAARLAWAQQRPHIKKVVVGHRESNIVSMKANQKHGFIFTCKETETWPDGRTEACLCYELKVR